MKPLAIHPDQLTADHIGLLITRDHAIAGTHFRKGHAITPEDLPVLARSTQPIHAVKLDVIDIPEAEAVTRIAAAVRGSHTTQLPAAQGRVNIRSNVRGLLTIDIDALLELNMNPEIGVFTHYDGLAVDVDALVAGVKIGPVAIAKATVDTALAAISAPIIDIRPFQPLVVTCIVAEDLGGRVRDRFEQTLWQKMDWYGAQLAPIVWVEEDADALAGALRQAVASSDLVLTAGSHMMDPLDPILQALAAIDAPLVRLGAPAHPGSMVWIANHGASRTPILSLASCSMFSRSTVADLLLPNLFAGVDVDNRLIARLGHGGLLDRGMNWRFPPYGETE